MNVLGIVYPWYWLQSDFDASFANQLWVFKVVFCYGNLLWQNNAQGG